MRAAAAAAAKEPVMAVGWKCRAWKAPGTARPTRHITSTAAMDAGRGPRPPAPARPGGGGAAREGLAPPGARGLGGGERRGDRDAARVDDGVLARVVEVEAVGEGGVGEHGVRRADPGARAE